MNKENKKKLNDFWETIVWKSNIENIYDKKLYNIINSIQKLNHELKYFKKVQNIIDEELFITKTKHYTISDQEQKIIDKISNIKYNSLHYVKTHSDAIPEYHKFIYDM